MSKLVFEIGTEEMPAVALPGALAQLRTALPDKLRRARLTFADITVLGTPRRLAVLVEGLPDRQPDEAREVRGPAWHVAFDANGKPTGAAQGFARKQGVPVAALRRVETPQGPYAVAQVVDQGKPTAEALGPVLEEMLRELSFPKTMRWGDRAVRFVRPVRWLLCLLDDQVVPLEFAGVVSGARTMGHRYLAGGFHPVAHADAYLDVLRRAFVMVDPAERRAAIAQQAETLTSGVGGRVPWDEDLLLENIHLVEWPTCILGRFEERFLQTPRPVLVTAMKKHQRFFPVEDTQGRLLPYFVSVRNGGSEHLDTVRAGNEAVLKARFEDAQHFFEQDKTIPLEAMAERLGRLLFQEKLGTMAQKRDRLVRLATALADRYGWSPEERERASRAALLCKADLTSQMVIELPALQGIMGREYALLHGEDPRIADAIAEHYQPRNAADRPPQSPLGKLLAVADRMDTLTGYAGLGISPTGSADPFGLRRAAQGVAEIVAEDPAAPPVVLMALLTADTYRDVNALELPRKDLTGLLATLFDQRVDAYLEEHGVRYDLRDAALSAGLGEGTLVHAVVRRAQTLQSVADDQTFVPTVQAAARTANILSLPPKLEPDVDSLLDRYRDGAAGFWIAALQERLAAVRPERFTEDAERPLYETAAGLVERVMADAAAFDFTAVYRTLQALQDPVNRFFDDVLVMCDDADLRENRLALLRLVDALYRVLADFRKVVVA